MGERSLGPGSGWGFDLLSAAYATGHAVLPIRPGASRIPEEVNPVTTRPMTPEEIERYIGPKSTKLVAAETQEQEGGDVARHLTDAESEERMTTLKRLIVEHPDWSRAQYSQEMGLTGTGVYSFLKTLGANIGQLRQELGLLDQVPQSGTRAPATVSPATVETTSPELVWSAPEPTTQTYTVPPEPKPPAPEPTAPTPPATTWTQQHTIRGRMPLEQLRRVLDGLKSIVGADAEIRVELTVDREGPTCHD